MLTDNIETESMTNEEGNDTTQGYGDEILPLQKQAGPTKGNLHLIFQITTKVSYPTVGWNVVTL